MENYNEKSDLNRSVFYLGAKWCGPCKKALPLYKEFAAEYSEDFDVRFFYIDIDEPKTGNETLDKQVSFVSSVPTLLVFSGGKLVKSISPWNRDKLYAAMHEHFVPGEEVDTSEIAQLKHAPMIHILPDSSSEDELSHSDEDDQLDLLLDVCEGPECSIIKREDSPKSESSE